MNIPSLLIPKAHVEYLRTKDSIEFALDIFRRNSYSAVPVINSDGIYRGTITEGDFLYYIMDNPDADLKKVKVRNILREDFYEAVKITASIDKLLIKCLDQNFVPVTDDRDVFVGIVTRKVIFKNIYEEQLKIKYGSE
nr:CBS domain-containing protein [uncultured Ruminococcus sp.]